MVPGVRLADLARAEVLGGFGKTLHPEQPVVIAFLSGASLVQTGPFGGMSKGEEVRTGFRGREGKQVFRLS